jgi:hypothetical protein
MKYTNENFFADRINLSAISKPGAEFNLKFGSALAILPRGPDRVQSGADSIGCDEGTKVHNRTGALVDALPNEAGAAFEAVASGAFSSAATAGFGS